MPLYVYECSACHKGFEEQRKIADMRAAAECPNCHAALASPEPIIQPVHGRVQGGTPLFHGRGR